MMNREIVFFGLRFTVFTFLLLAFAWTISLFCVWPYFMKITSGWVYVLYSFLALLIAGFVNRKILLLLIAAFLLSKSIVVWFQNFMLVISSFLVTLIYLFFAHMSFWKFMIQFLIIMVTVFVYYIVVIKVLRIIDEEN